MSKPAWLLMFVSALAVLVMAFIEPIAQDPAYHLFADHRQWWLIPNTLDVLSNLPFVFVGIMGLQHCALHREHPLFWPFLAIFIGVFCTAYGSAFYHWAPGNQTLVWDRLPMTIAFMGLFSLVLADRIDMRWAKALWPLLMLGVASVWYWAWTEVQGVGDLRPYALIQFLPMLLIPLMLIMYPAPRRDFGCYIGLICCYGLAKVLEYFDVWVFELTGLVSGHTLKHLAAGLATLFLYRLWKQHTQRPNQSG
ncbi:MAG: protein phosphatase 2C-like protein [Pseudomonadales bacterium]